MRLARVQVKLEEYSGEGPPGEFYFGNAEAALSALSGKGVTVDMIYMDPPFLTGRHFGMYDDRQSRQQWLAMMQRALTLCRGLLAGAGSLYLHVDHRLSAHARILLDEVFGEERFQNEIIWAYRSGGRATTRFRRKHDTIFLYSKGPSPYYMPQYTKDGAPPANHMKRGMDEAGREYRSIVSAGKEYRYYSDQGVLVDDVWTDISHLQQRDPERTGYATQKPERLLRRMVAASCPPGGMVLDPFCGSGTAIAAALAEERLGIGADASGEALRVVRKRFLGRNLLIHHLQSTPEPEDFRVYWQEGQALVEGADEFYSGYYQGDRFAASQRPGSVPCLLIQKGGLCAFYTMEEENA